QVRKFDAAWSREAAQAALAERILEHDAPAAAAEPVSRSLGDLVDEYLRYKSDNGKRSLKEDRRILRKRVLPAFGPALAVGDLTGAAIAQYERQRIGEVSAFTVANELTVLRHMLRLGRRWGYLSQVPDIELPKKPKACQRYLDEAEITRLLAACRASRNPH